MNSTVRNVMTTSVVAVKRTADFKEVVTVLRRLRVSACPVIDDEFRVVGVVSEADLLCKEADPQLPTGLVRLRWKLAEDSKATAETAADLMTAPAVTIHPGASVVDAARMMAEHHVKRLPVVGSGGRLVGIVSRADLLSVFERPDAAIAAEVSHSIVAGQFGLQPAEVTVEVSSGVVTLAGVVADAETALRLIAAARHAEGVIAVRNRLTAASDSGWSPDASRPDPAGVG